MKNILKAKNVMDKRLAKYIKRVKKEFIKEKNRAYKSLAKYGARRYRIIFGLSELELAVERRIFDDLIKNVVERRTCITNGFHVGKIEYAWYVFCQFEQIFKNEDVEILNLAKELMDKDIEIEERRKFW